MKYTVKAYEVYSVDIDVEAEDVDDARQKAEDILSAGEYENGQVLSESVYDFTMDSDDWTVWEN
jgi:hypothetical protein